MFLSDVSDIGKYSLKKIKLSCDDCNVCKEISYKSYTSYGYTNGDYLCRKCKLIKNNKEKYGVSNVFQLDSVKEKIKQTNLEKYGVSNVSQSEDVKKKIKQTNLEKYGHTHHMKNTEILHKLIKNNKEKYGVSNISQLDSVKEKIKQTNLDRYGVPYLSQSIEFKNSIICSNLKKYGVEHTFQLDSVKEKIKQTNLEKYGVVNPSENPLIKEKIRKTKSQTEKNKIINDCDNNIIDVNQHDRIFKILCDNCSNIFDITYSLFYKRRETKTKICTICNPINRNISGKEIEMREYIESVYNGVIENNYRIDNKELDIYLPDLKLAFEFNGIYWHSDLFKTKWYHNEKTNVCGENDITLIHIWEDDWDYKRDIVKSMIYNKMGLTDIKIYARNCDIRIVNKLESDNFLNDHHIQGKCNSSVKIGLYYNDELSSLMTFKKNKGIYDLNRFCSKKYTLVIGGASKIFKYFIKKYKTDVYTFSDNSYSTGDLYNKLGFIREYDLPPDYRYIISDIRMHKFNFRNKETNHLNKIFDSGKIKYSFKYSI